LPPKSLKFHIPAAFIWHSRTTKSFPAARRTASALPNVHRIGSFESMMPSPGPVLQQELEQHITIRTGRRVRNLTVELCPERVVLRGRAINYHVKQLAQHGVRELL